MPWYKHHGSVREARPKRYLIVTLWCENILIIQNMQAGPRYQEDPPASFKTAVRESLGDRALDRTGTVCWHCFTGVCEQKCNTA